MSGGFEHIGAVVAQVVADTIARREQRFDSTDEYATEKRRAEGVLEHSASALTTDDRRRVE